MLSLLFPVGLLGLLAIPIIILLHLQRERPRRRSVPSILLWRRLASVQRHPEPKRLPLTLLLLLHLLVAALLGLALARPVLPGNGPDRAGQTILLLDTSTSMAATDVAPSRFAQALRRVEQYADSLGPQDTLTLIRLSPTARVVARITGAPADGSAWQTLAPAGTTLDLRTGLNLANGLLDPARANRIVILTDATWLPETLDPLAEPVGAPVTWEPVGGPQGNQAIVAFAARPLPVGGTDLIARVKNFAGAPVTRTLRLLGAPQPGQPAPVLGDHPLSLGANGEVVQHWVLPDNQHDLVQAELSGTDAQPLDDRATLSLAEHETLPVRLVGRESDALTRVLAALPGLVVDATIPPGAAALTVYSGELPATFPAGAVLLVNPPAGAALLGPPSERVKAPPAPGDPLVRELDLSSVTFGGRSASMPAWAEPVLVDTRRSPRVLIWRGTRGPTRIVALNFDLEQTNLPTKLAFPLLMARVVGELTPTGIPAAVTLGEPVAFPWEAAEFRVLGPDGVPLTIEEHGDARVVRPQTPGLYTVETGDPVSPAATRAVARFAAQAGAPLESDLRPSQRQHPPAIAQIPLVKQGTTTPHRELAPWLVMSALALLLLEQIYARLRHGT
ncbi:MAG: VWA domain-containing protein [Ardenticatenaceae bacterium]|nr:VWA domain-containing protein [Ardenticatenaceae bacterium]